MKDSTETRFCSIVPVYCSRRKYLCTTPTLPRRYSTVLSLHNPKQSSKMNATKTSICTAFHVEILVEDKTASSKKGKYSTSEPVVKRESNNTTASFSPS